MSIATEIAQDKSTVRQGAKDARTDGQDQTKSSKKKTRKQALPILPGIASGESRKARLSGATLDLIKSKTAASGASPSDAVFMGAMLAMSRKKHQLPKVQKGEELDLQLPPKVWEFLDSQVEATKSDLDTVLKAYLEL